MLVTPPELSSAAALYTHLGVSAAEQAYLTKYARFRYSTAIIPKRRGGQRVLRVPEPRLKHLQRMILALLEPLYAVRAPVHGFVKDRSAMTNADAHQARPYLLNVDISDFFGSISRRRVHGMLTAVGLAKDVADALCVLCVTGDQLPQGSPTSPILSNMICYRLDRELMAFAKAHRLRYTRYADDITFSAYTPPLALFDQGLPVNGLIAVASLSAQLRTIFAANGFHLNTGKLRFSGLRGRKEVTGLVVNEFTNLRRTFIRNVRASLYKIETLGLPAAQIDYASRYKSAAQLEDVLRGRLEWIAQVRGRSFDPYRTLAARFNTQFPEKPLPISPTMQEIANRAVWVVEYFYTDPIEGLMHVQGTAFFLEGVGLVSSDHNFDNLPVGKKASLFRPADPTKIFTAWPSVKRDPARDLIILEHDVPPTECAELPRSPTPPRLKEPIIAIGFPEYGPGDEMAELSGSVINRPTKSNVRLIEVTAILGNGLSGGPVTNDRHQVLGIVKRGGLTEPKQHAVDVDELDAL